eukprot:Gb_33037 [translate_table: standard]
MGCASSKIDNEEKVARCKERKRFMRQAVSSRHEFAAAQIAYLQALRNTGVTLRQFAEVESMELHRTSPYHIPHYQITLPPSPPPLPPPPPPPPMSLSPSPIHRSASFRSSIPDYSTSAPVDNNINAQAVSSPKTATLEQHWNTHQDSDTEPLPPPPPPPAQGSAWDFWDPFPASSPLVRVHEQRRTPQGLEEELRKQQQQQQVEEEQWDETATEFEDEPEVENNRLLDKSPGQETDDNSSMVSWYTKDTDLAMVISRKRKNLGEIVRELDDYFLKASAGGKEVSRILEASKGYCQHNFGESKRNSYHSAKVFSALSWTWSSKSPLAGRDAVEFNNADESSTRGSHCSTLERLYTWEKRLYEEVRSGESAKIDYKNKLALLRNQEAKGRDGRKVDKTRATVELLQSQILLARNAIDTTSTSILKLRENELYPQLIELSEGLMQMWRSMYECHQVQNHIVQQVNHLDSLAGTEATSDYHRQATIQLESEVSAWYTSFCSLIKSQRDYMRALNGWMKHSLYQLENEAGGNIEHSPPISALCEEWQQALDRLPDKPASEAIKSFVTVIHAMVVQQGEEQKHRRKSERLSKELEKKLASLSNMEKKYNVSVPNRTGTSLNSGLDPKDPLAVKRAKTDAFRRKVEEEKSKHLNSIRVTRAMTLNNLQTGLPNVFQAMTGFSSVCMQAFEAVHNQTKSFKF